MLFDPIIPASLLILAASGGGNPCAPPKPAEITVTPAAAQVRYDYSKTLRQMQAVRTDTINPFGTGSVTITHGYTQGVISTEPEVMIGYQTYPSRNFGCLWYDKIKVKISLTPTIAIPKEIRRDECMHRAIIEHEMKHVAVDRAIVRKYAGIIGRRVHDALSQRGFSAGPIPIQSINAVSAQMQQVVFQIVDRESKRMDLERMDAQQAIDTAEEYRRIGAMCPGFSRTR